MSSLIKKSRKRKYKLTKPPIEKKLTNIAIYYALQRRKKLMSHQKVTFHECKLGKYMTKWKSLPSDHPDKIATKQSFRQYNLAIDLALKRNVACPSYKKLVNF